MIPDLTLEQIAAIGLALAWVGAVGIAFAFARRRERQAATQLDAHYPEPSPDPAPEPRRLTPADVVALRCRFRARRELTQRFGAEGAAFIDTTMRRIATEALPPDELQGMRQLAVRLQSDPTAARDHCWQIADAFVRLLDVHVAVNGRKPPASPSPEPTKPRVA